MKRYNPVHLNCPCEAVMEEDPKGEWVRYEDVQNHNEWETVSEIRVCSYHKEYPSKFFPGCTCSTERYRRRKTNKTILGLPVFEIDGKDFPDISKIKLGGSLI